MPWKPRYSEFEARAAIRDASTWAAVLDALGYQYHGKNIETVRKWAQRWEVPINHLPDHRGGSFSRLRYSEADLRRAVAASRSWAETLRRLSYCPTGGNWKTLKKRVADLEISTAHFDPYARTRERGRRDRIPLEAILVEGSSYSRTNLKQRLYAEGLKSPRCELCGQGDEWRGKRIGLILDRCQVLFTPKYRTQRYCSRDCGSRWDRTGFEFPRARKVERPSHERLVREIGELGYRTVGRKYGVSDNAVRKWIRSYEVKGNAQSGRQSSPS
jgi:hypothetical protein